jgi:outer membrane protein TolC
MLLKRKNYRRRLLKMTRFNNKFIGLLIVVLYGCTIGSNYTRPHLPVPEKWSTNELPVQAGPRETLKSWWTKFNDPVLTELIQKATRRNLNLRQAIARIDESRALFQAATGKKLPELEASGSVVRRKESENAFPIPVLLAQGLNTTILHLKIKDV